MVKKNSLAVFLKFSMNVLIILGAAMYLTLFYQGIFIKDLEIQLYKKIITYILFIIGGGSLLTILFYLKNIVDSIVKYKPFIWDNVKSLKRISIACFVICGTYIVNFFLNTQYKSFHFVDFDTSGIHTDMEFIIFFFAGCFIFVLSEVFKQAVEIKEENDYTV